MNPRKPLLFIIQFIAQWICAQTQYNFTRYSADDGLVSNKIHLITEDNQGYIWLASKEGLMRFDAYSFKSYLSDGSDSNSLPDNAVFNLDFTKGGIMFAKTKTGLSRYDPRNDHFVRLLSFTDSTDALAIQPGVDNRIWICTPHSLLDFDLISGQSNSFPLPENISMEQGNNFGMSLHNDLLWIYDNNNIFVFDLNQKYFFAAQLLDKSNNKLLITNYNKKEIVFANNKSILICRQELFVFSASDKNFHQLGENTILHKDNDEIENIIFQDENSMIFSAKKNDLLQFNFADEKEERILLHTPNDKKIPKQRVALSVVQDDDGTVWFTTDGNGLFHFDPKKKSAEQFMHQADNENSISSNTVAYVYLDRSGVFWLACRGQGLVKMEKIKQIFHPFSIDRKAISPTPRDDQNVRSVCELDNNQLLLGTIGGLFSFSKMDSSINELPWWPFNKIPNGRAIGALYKDDQGKIWIGKWGAGNVNVYDQRNNKMVSLIIHSDDLSMSCKIVRTITQDKDKNIWIGTVCGLFKVKPSLIDNAVPNSELIIQEFQNTDLDFIQNAAIYALLVDHRNRLWIGTEIGLNVLDISSGMISKYVNRKNDPLSLSFNNVRSLLQDRDGIIWVGTNGGGLSRFDETNEQFINYTVKDGLPNDAIFSIQQDNDGFLWLATNNGLCRFDSKNSMCRNFILSDGLQNSEFNTNASYKNSSGELFFGGVKGFNYFDPKSIAIKDVQQEVTITNLKVFDRSIAFDTSLITLAHDQNYLSFEFAAQNHYRTQDNRYSYILEGEDKNWIFAGNRRYASYTNLRPGNYVFHVRISGSSNINGAKTSLTILIRKPWYQTPIAIFFFTFAITALVYALFRLQHAYVIRRERETSRIREAELKTQVLEEKNQSSLRELEKAKELEQAYNQLKAAQEQLIQQEKLASLGQLTAGIAHEIKNPLNFVSNFSETSADILDELIEATSDTERIKLSDELKQNLEKIRKHSKRADNIIKNMLQHSRIGSGEKTSTDLNAICDEFLDLSYHGMRATHREFNCKLEKNLLVNLPKVNIVGQDISRVLLNLYNNSFQAVHEKEKMMNEEKSRKAGKNAAQSFRVKSETNYQPTVSVTTEVKDHSVIVKVRDNGSGIPEGIKQKIFEPFFTTKPSGSGTGLGLSLSYDIMKAHGGEIKVESRENEFTEFTVSIPI